MSSDRHEKIAIAVDAHNRAHKPPLSHSTVRLLAAMFADADACQRSLLALEDATGISHSALQRALHVLVAAGLIAKETAATPAATASC